jgi:5'-methylthioadenosine phosphorylase
VEGIWDVKPVRTETPFGAPSDEITLASLGGVRVAFLPRHGRGHRLLPTEVPSRANIAALKTLGVEKILSFSAVGSLHEPYAPRDFVVPDQLIDRTRHRPDTFFGDGIVGHVAFAHPFADKLGDVVFGHLQQMPGVKSHHGGTLVCMEGPLFSTKAESELYRSWGAHLINMSALRSQARAGGIEQRWSLVTDTTSASGTADVKIQMVIANLNANGRNAQELIKRCVKDVAAARPEISRGPSKFRSSPPGYAARGDGGEVEGNHRRCVAARAGPGRGAPGATACAAPPPPAPAVRRSRPLLRWATRLLRPSIRAERGLQQGLADAPRIAQSRRRTADAR